MPEGPWNLPPRMPREAGPVPSASFPQAPAEGLRVPAALPLRCRVVFPGAHVPACRTVRPPEGVARLPPAWGLRAAAVNVPAQVVGCVCGFNILWSPLFPWSSFFLCPCWVGGFQEEVRRASRWCDPSQALSRDSEVTSQMGQEAGFQRDPGRSS